MALSIRHNFSQFSSTQLKVRLDESARLVRNSVRCEATLSSATSEELVVDRETTLKNGKDSLEISRVVNGMWQTSGGWGKIDRDDAVSAMLKYADAGLSTFDMADICKAYPFSSN